MSGVKDLSFRNHERLRRRSEFKDVERSGVRKISRSFIVYAKKNTLDYSRIGLTVSRKVGHSPIRNWWKRRLREAYRNNKSNIPSSVDFVVIVRPSKRKRPSFAVLPEELIEILNEYANGE